MIYAGDSSLTIIDFGPEVVFNNLAKLTSTRDNLKLPVNCVLAGDQPQIDREKLVAVWRRIFRE